MKTTPIHLARCMVVAFSLLWAAAISVEQSKSDRSFISWIDRGVVNGTTYSVIVEAANLHPSSQFGDRRRVQFFNRLGGGDRVVSVQYAPHLPEPSEADGPLIVQEHPDSVDKRVRIVFLSDIKGDYPPDMVRHGRTPTAL